MIDWNPILLQITIGFKWTIIFFSLVFAIMLLTEDLTKDKDLLDKYKKKIKELENKIRSRK